MAMLEIVVTTGAAGTRSGKRHDAVEDAVKLAAWNTVRSLPKAEVHFRPTVDGDVFALGVTFLFPADAVRWKDLLAAFKKNLSRVSESVPKGFTGVEGNIAGYTLRDARTNPLVEKYASGEATWVSGPRYSEAPEGEKFLSLAEQARRREMNERARAKKARRASTRSEGPTAEEVLFKMQVVEAREKASRARAPKAVYSKAYLDAKGMKRRNPAVWKHDRIPMGAGLYAKASLSGDTMTFSVRNPEGKVKETLTTRWHAETIRSSTDTVLRYLVQRSIERGAPAPMRQNPLEAYRMRTPDGDAYLEVPLPGTYNKALHVQYSGVDWSKPGSAKTLRILPSSTGPRGIVEDLIGRDLTADDLLIAAIQAEATAQRMFDSYPRYQYRDAAHYYEGLTEVLADLAASLQSSWRTNGKRR
jgi:hypothetical protein